MSDEATHASDCGWQVGQYPWECTCGLIARLIIAMDELIAQDADLIEKIALKPCPFCGSPAVAKDNYGDERNGYAHTYTIACKGCGCSVTRTDRQNPKGGYALTGTGEAEAIAAWNTRPQPSAEPVDAGDGVQQWECFCDASYFDMWCVREVGERRFGHGFYLVNGDEAQGLCDHLNEQARHRSTAAAAERARIVAWLRKERREAVQSRGEVK